MRVVHRQRQLGVLSAQDDRIARAAVLRRDAGQRGDAVRVRRRPALVFEALHAQPGQAQLAQQVHGRGRVAFEQELAQMLRDRRRVERHAELLGLDHQAELAVGRAQRQIAQRGLRGFAQVAADAHREAPDAERRHVVLQADLEAERRMLGQGEDQVLDQPHFLLAGDQRIRIVQLRFLDAGAEQAGLGVHAMARGEVDHDLADRDRMPETVVHGAARAAQAVVVAVAAAVAGNARHAAAKALGADRSRP